MRDNVLLRTSLAALSFMVCDQALEAAPSSAQSAPVSGNSDAPPAGQSIATKRPWSPEDSVAVRYFRDANSDGQWGLSKEPSYVQYSPSHDRFYFVSMTGDLSCDCVVTRMEVYSIKGLQDALARNLTTRPVPISSLSTRAPEQGISEVQWEDNGHLLFYARMDADAKKQFYRLDVVSGKITQLTDSKNSLNRAFVKGDSLIYHEALSVPYSRLQDTRSPYSLTTRDLATAFFSRPNTSQTKLETFARIGSAPTWALVSGWAQKGGPWWSPDGRRAVMVRTPPTVPPSWIGYDGHEDGTVGVNDVDQPLLPAEFPQFYEIDLVNRTERPLIDAPTGRATRSGESDLIGFTGTIAPAAFWTGDGRRVVLVNTALPVDWKDNGKRKFSAGYVVVVDMQTKSNRVLEPVVSESGSTITRAVLVGETLLIERSVKGIPTSATLYHLQGSKIRSQAVAVGFNLQSPPKIVENQTRPLDLKITVVEDANHAPAIYAELGDRRIALTDPDPVFEKVRVADRVSFSWSDSRGRTYTGSLLMPGEFAGKSIPLVIQAHTNAPTRFYPDGEFPTAFAAQTLVARGFAVLNLDYGFPEKGHDATEMAEFSDAVQQAILALASKKNIDPNRVGLVGFSRNGYRILQLLIHAPQIRVRAALIADSIHGGYDDYLTGFATGYNVSADLEREFGGPFWKNKDAWYSYETSFNVDRIQAPMLFVDNGASATVSAAALIGALKANKKPFDYMIIQEGAHSLQVPSQRIFSMNLTVDWMDFWINDREDLSPSKAEQYRRWRALKRNYRAGRPS